MRAKTEELLNLLTWTAEMLLRPTFRNLTESYESWAYRNGLFRQLGRLEQLQWIESKPNPAGGRLHRLTEAGRLHALGGRDPEARWGRSWDGRWRLILFDVPETLRGMRNKLRRYLRDRGFGYLQNSVWITPDIVTEQRALLAEGPVDVESLLLLEARPAAGESDAQIVAGAWDWEAINQAYVKHQTTLSRRPHGALNTETAAKFFQRWMREERAAWMNAQLRDPMLPTLLLPEGYAGCRAWKTRLQVMREAGKQLRSFKPA